MDWFAEMTEVVLAQLDSDWSVIDSEVLVCSHGNTVEYDGHCWEDGCINPLRAAGLIQVFGPFGRSADPDPLTSVGQLGPAVVRDYPDYAPRPGERGWAIVPYTDDPSGIEAVRVIGYRDGLAILETSRGTIRVSDNDVFVFRVMALAAVDFMRYAATLADD